MAGSFNKVLLMGNLTRDVEMRHTTGNMAVAKFAIAVNRKFKTASGEQRDEVTFVECEAWGRTAEVMAQYLAKGRPVFVEGRLKLDEWEDKNGGGKRSRIMVVVESFQFVDSGQGGPGAGGGDRPPARSAAPASGGYSRSAPRQDEPVIDHDDIPF